VICRYHFLCTNQIFIKQMNGILQFVLAAVLLLSDMGVTAWNVGSGAVLSPILASSSGAFLITVDNAFSLDNSFSSEVAQSGQVQCAFSRSNKFELLILGAVIMTPALWLSSSNRLQCFANFSNCGESLRCNLF